MWEILLPFFSKLIDKFVPDPAAKQAALLQLAQMKDGAEARQLAADLQLMLAQANIDSIEAQSTSLFKSGWRPFVGWVCGFGFGYMLLMRPILPWLFNALGGHAPDMPSVDLGVLTTTLGALLGVGTMRSIEKVKGVA